jgi:hypothetical protein
VTASIKDELRRINKAKQELAKYDKEKVDYVKRCQDDIMDAISDSYFDENGEYLEENRPIGSTLSEIKRDYMVVAIEDDLMTEEEFEDILDLIDIIDLEYAAANS